MRAWSRTGALVLAAVLAGCTAQAGGRVEPVPRPEAVATSVSPAPEAPPAAPLWEKVGPELSVGRAPRATSAPAPQPFAMSLYTDGDFVPQHTFEWCVAASIQMTYNMARDPNRTSADDQRTIWHQARARSNDRWGGASGRGWARLLTEWGVGEYELASFDDYDEALRAAARAMRATDLAVGLIVWSGRHAWVMSGFESVGDPALHDDFDVTGIRVLDPLYPHGSARWGPSPEPNALLTPNELALQFKPRSHSNGPDSPAGFVLVLPVARGG